MTNIEELFYNNLNFVQHEFLTKEECDQALQDFNSIENTKSLMREKFQYFTVGNSFLEHLDKATGQRLIDRTPENVKIASDQYLSKKGPYLPIHNILLDKFKNLFQTEVRYLNYFSVPGFSYSLPIDGTNEQPAHIWHYDNEKTYYPYQVEFPNYTDLSYFDDIFTMTIMLTQGEFTYDYFKETYATWPRIEKDICPSHFRLRGDNCENFHCILKSYLTVKYNQGTINIGRQSRLHRIGKSIFAGQPRITIQMHSVMKDNIIYLYW